MERMFYTPEGVRDVYNGECKEKDILESRLHHIFHQYGYQDIETPTFEYFEVFSREMGTIPSKELYKFFDREGNTLVLRPDFTPSIARAASMYFTENLPVRLCYKGSTFINHSSYQGRLKESTQMGIEFIGDDSVDSDGEVLALMIQLLKEAGLKDFQVSIGQVDFFKSLLEEANMDDEMQEQLREQISNKNFFGVEELISELHLEANLEKSFLELPQLFGSIEVLEKARLLTSNPKAIAAISRLEDIYEILTYYGCEQYVFFDLSMLSKYKYYTGIIFQAYTYGTGDALIKGGRYNHLLEHFDLPAAAIGFGVVMENFMDALSRQGIKLLPPSQKSLILYCEERKQDAIIQAMTYRAQGKEVELIRAELGKPIEEYRKGETYYEIFDLCTR